MQMINGKSKKPIVVKVKCNFQFKMPTNSKKPTDDQLNAPLQALQDFLP
jgi:hypothetical protein